MTLKIRRILYAIFIIAFLIIAPVVSFYAAGYKFSLSGIKFQKTGTFIFDTEPEGAKIFINGKQQQTFLKRYYSKEKSFITTPAKIKNILPGEYNVKFELDGYLLWQKKLTIHPGTSTYAENVYLFKKNLPMLINSGKIEYLKLAPNQNKIAMLSSEQIKIIDLNSETEIIKLNIKKTPAGCSWAPNNNKILINKSIIDITDGKNEVNLTDYIKTEINNIKWDINDSSKLYYTDKNSINNFIITAKTNKLLFKNLLFDDYLIKNDNLYLITRTGNVNHLEIFQLSSGERIKKISLPGSSNYNFINSSHQLINLYDHRHQILYLINPFSSFYSPFQETINNIKYAYWINDEKMLYANNFEIWIFDLKNNKKTLLTRISKAITGVIWHPNNNYIIYSTDTAINSIELDEREKYNITEITKFNKIKFLFLNNKGDALYFYAKIGNQEGLYKLMIQ